MFKFHDFAFFVRHQLKSFQSWETLLEVQGVTMVTTATMVTITHRMTMDVNQPLTDSTDFVFIPTHVYAIAELVKVHESLRGFANRTEEHLLTL